MILSRWGLYAYPLLLAWRLCTPNPWKPSSWFSRHLGQDQLYQVSWIFPQASPWLAFDKSPHTPPQKGVFRRAQWLGDRVVGRAGLLVSWGQIVIIKTYVGIKRSRVIDITVIPDCDVSRRPATIQTMLTNQAVEEQ